MVAMDAVNNGSSNHINGILLGMNWKNLQFSSAGQVITCRAAIAYGPKQALVIEEGQVDPPQAMEVHIRITHTSFCHSDITFWEAENEALLAFPCIFGHKAAGIVESIGEGITDLQEGDHVIPFFTGERGSYAYCKSEKTNLCGKLRINLTKRFMVLLSCGISTGVGAMWNTANMQAGLIMAIFGLGSVGLTVVEGTRIRGASRIISVDTNPSKFAKAKALGVTECISPKEYDEPIHEVTWGICNGGVDYNLGFVKTY